MKRLLCMLILAAMVVIVETSTVTARSDKACLFGYYGYCDWEGTNGVRCSAICEDEKESCMANSPSRKVYSDAACTVIKDEEYVEKDCGVWCPWDFEEGTPNCTLLNNRWFTCSEIIAMCNSYFMTYATEAACKSANATTSVSFVGNAAKTSGLRVSYAKNRVSVNWTPTVKVSSGTIQLLNAKGVAMSTSYIKANSGKVTAKLGTVGVPAGMYFVHISAVGANGQKIVSQSAVSIVK